jgi:AraC-like DNA-binding protein
MQRASTLLENTFMSVKEISHEVGFRDVSHFVRDFKKLFGTSPTSYRRLTMARQGAVYAPEQQNPPRLSRDCIRYSLANSRRPPIQIPRTEE